MNRLCVKGVTRHFGGLTALRDITFDVEPGSIYGVIGPNGAGKTTLFNIIAGLYAPSEGEVVYGETRLTGLAPYAVAACGLARTFQNVSVFPGMSVLENVMIGRHRSGRAGLWSSCLHLPRQRRDEAAIRADATRYLADLGLHERAGVPVGALSFGQRRMVELARALATEPSLLLLDEPASGLTTRETDDLAEHIRNIRARNITVLLVEHNMSLVMDICDTILVLDFGRRIACGAPAEIRNDARVTEVYLGGDQFHVGN